MVTASAADEEGSNVACGLRRRGQGLVAVRLQKVRGLRWNAPRDCCVTQESANNNQRRTDKFDLQITARPSDPPVPAIAYTYRGVNTLGDPKRLPVVGGCLTLPAVVNGGFPAGEPN
jgi:hypothetical protein